MMDVKEKSAWDRALESGIDMSLVESNLRLSFGERLHRHDAALNTMLKLRQAVKRRNERTD